MWTWIICSTYSSPDGHGNAGMTRITHHGVRHPRRTALFALLFVLVAAVLGGRAASQLNAPNAFEDPSSQAAHARTQIEAATGFEPTAGVIALVHGAPLSAAAVSAARTLSHDPGVARVATYANTHDSALLSRDGRSTLVAASLHADAQPDAVVDRLTKDFAGSHEVQLGGADVSLRQTNLQATKDLGFADRRDQNDDRDRWPYRDVQRHDRRRCDGIADRLPAAVPAVNRDRRRRRRRDRGGSVNDRPSSAVRPAGVAA
jgi:hypothetical protein